MSFGGQSKKKHRQQDAEIILIDEEELASRHGTKRKDYSLPGIAQRILKKSKGSNGLVKYLVKWEGYSEDDATWETEEAMREKHNDLIQDYEFYVLTGERFDDNGSKSHKTKPSKQNKPDQSETRSKSKQSNSSRERRNKLDRSKRAIKCAGRDQQSYMREDYEDKSKKQPADINNNHKSVKKLKELEKKKQSVYEPFVDFDMQLQKSIDQIDSEMNNMIQTQYKQLSNIKCSFDPSNDMQSTPNDKVEKVTLTNNNNEQIFRIEWQTRSDGKKPLTEFYSYALISQICPQLCLKFMESILFDTVDSNLNVKFQCIGETAEEKLQLITQTVKNSIMPSQKPIEEEPENNQMEVEAQVEVPKEQNIEVEKPNEDNNEQQKLSQLHQESEIIIPVVQENEIAENKDQVETVLPLKVIVPSEPQGEELEQNGQIEIEVQQTEEEKEEVKEQTLEVPNQPDQETQIENVEVAQPVQNVDQLSAENTITVICSEDIKKDQPPNPQCENIEIQENEECKIQLDCQKTNLDNRDSLELEVDEPATY